MDKLERITKAIDDWTKDRPTLKLTDTPDTLVMYIFEEAQELVCAQGLAIEYFVEEIADVLIYCIQLMILLDVDVYDAIMGKVVLNSIRSQQVNLMTV